MTFLQKWLYGLIAFCCLASTACVWAQADHTNRLIEGAKKEGRLLWYTALTINDGSMLTQHF